MTYKCLHTTTRQLSKGQCIVCEDLQGDHYQNRRQRELSPEEIVQRVQAVTDSEQLAKEVQEELLLLDREIGRNSLLDFFKQAVVAGEVPGITTLEDAPYISAMCWEIQNFFEGWLAARDLAPPAMQARVDTTWAHHKLQRIKGELLVQNMVWNVPPSTLKSTIAMVIAPAWMWLHCPSFKFGCASGNERNVKRDSQACRDIVTSQWYKRTFDIQWSIRTDADSVGKWVTSANGERISTTTGAGFTGTHVHALLIDDPDDANKVFNEPARRSTQDKFQRAIENRVVDERIALRLVLQQRVHIDDMSAFLLARGRWTPSYRKGYAQLVIPMEAGRQPEDSPTETPYGWQDWRTIADECIHPTRFPPEVIADLRTKLGSAGFGGQYNQNPKPEGGGLINIGWFKFFRLEDTNTSTIQRPIGCTSEPALVLKRKRDGALDLDWLTVTVDCSNGSESNTASAVGILVCGGKDQRRFVFDDHTKVMGILDMYAAVKAVIGLYGAKRVLIELKAAGSSLIADLKQALAKGDIIGPDGKKVIAVVEAITDVRDSKEGRANAMLPAIEAGLVYLLDGAQWLTQGRTPGDKGFLDEVCNFPNSKRDDRVDALSQLMTYYRQNDDNTRRARIWL